MITGLTEAESYARLSCAESLISGICLAWLGIYQGRKDLNERGHQW